MYSLMHERRPSQQTAVAYHEAGHAVVAHAQHVKIRAVTIRPQDDALGQVVVKHPRWFLPELNAGSEKGRVLSYAIDVAVVIFAGPAAERLFTGRHNHVGADFDYQTVGSLAANLCGSERQRRAMLRWLRVTADELVASDRIREGIEAVAQSLIKRQRLTSGEVNEVILSSTCSSRVTTIDFR
jgi:ATP-dependent Zn protease